MEHAKRPWMFTGVMIESESDGEAIAYPIGNNRDEDMKLIVRAVNAFDAMRSALVQAIPQMEYKLSHTQTAEGRRNVARVMKEAREALKLADKEY